ncbi:hypothetical protein [Pseudalkalibacillus berkeleyi]|uniref:Uncharacterized protein n=1 Tax=Pseudalkalibacillus berkeleyi TaxID=1069813 RepID=A0ABS9GUI4_9BACL|nr:hypothetical protein [Pseudalkalibacillus berkeleyi]MCF6136497.1 hypothetical protein [Pseudalkalibacillus berkeleyi]
MLSIVSSFFLGLAPVLSKNIELNQQGKKLLLGATIFLVILMTSGFLLTAHFLPKLLI